MRVTNAAAWQMFLLTYERSQEWAMTTRVSRVQGGLLISSAHDETLADVAEYAASLGLTVERLTGSVKVMAL